MNPLLPDWDLQRAAPLAPDPRAFTVGRKLASLTRWKQVATDEHSLWGEFKGSGSTPYQVQIDLLRLNAGHFSFKCTCPSRKQPCKHALGLLVLAIEAHDGIPRADAPDRVKVWLDSVAQRARKILARQKKRDNNTISDSTQGEATRQKRLSTIQSGMADLERWLRGIVHGGLGDPALRNYSFWEDRAARMIDAQAPGVSSRLRNIAGLHAREQEWEEVLLLELGRLFLLARAWRNYDSLSSAMQFDLRTASGWTIKKEEIDGDSLSDSWRVVGKLVRRVDKQLREQQLWLVGTSTRRKALILEYSFGDTPFSTTFSVGQSMSGSLRFFPGSRPVRAIPGADLKKTSIELNIPCTSTFSDELDWYANMLAANPWRVEQLFLIKDLLLLRQQNRWLLYDSKGAHINLQNSGSLNWPLYSFGGEAPFDLAGIWNGSMLIPLVAANESGQVDLRILEQLI